MNGVVPLSKAVSNVLQQSCSKIPHLRLHILQKQARTGCLPNKTRFSSIRQKRWQHTSLELSSAVTSTSRADVSVDEEPQSASEDTLSRILVSTSSEISAEGQETRAGTINQDIFERYAKLAAIDPANIYEILQEGHPERVLQALLDPVIGTTFVANASDAMFAEAICSLDPQYFVEPYKNIYRDLNPSLENKPIYRYVRPIEERFEIFVAHIETIIARRRDSGHRLDLAVYKHLLGCAEAMGDLKMAKSLWDSMVGSDKTEPDLECYNSLLAAHVWSNAFSATERRKLRVIEENLTFRSRTKRIEAFSGHRVSPPGEPYSEERGIRHQTLEVFRQLNGKGMMGNEKTFTNLMIGMARESDLDGVESILKSVWNVDVGLLAKYDEEEVESPTFYEEKDPLRPSEHLLFTIVHIYCTNNDVSTATSLLDYVSRNYDLRIPHYVWTHLHDWSYVLSRRRYPRRTAQRYETGLVDAKTVERIHQVMTDEPHNIKPTVPMVITLSNVSRKSHSLDQTYDYIKEALEIFNKNQAELSDLFDTLRNHIRHVRTLSPWDGFLPAEFLTLRHRFILLSLKIDGDLELIMRAFSALFRESEWAGSGRLAEWSHRRLPSIIREHPEFMPNEVRYLTPTGEVTIEGGKAHRTQAVNKLNQSLMTRVGILRAALDTDNYNKLLRGFWGVDCDDRRGGRLGTSSSRK